MVCEGRHDAGAGARHVVGERAVRAERVGHRRGRVAAKARDRIGLVWRAQVDEVMQHPPPRARVGLGGADVHAAIDQC